MSDEKRHTGSNVDGLFEKRRSETVRLMSFLDELTLLTTDELNQIEAGEQEALSLEEIRMFHEGLDRIVRDAKGALPAEEPRILARVNALRKVISSSERALKNSMGMSTRRN